MTGMDQDYFFAILFGLPLLLLVIALIAGHLYRDGYDELLDWKPTRSAEREAELEHGDIHQMLAAQNRHRRRRGAPERTLEEATGHSWASLASGDLYGEPSCPPER